MFSVGHIWILAILLIIVLIIWGPGKLPDVGSGLGRAIHEFRKASTDAKNEFNSTVNPQPAQQAPTAAAPVPQQPAPVPAATQPAPQPVPAAPAAPAETTPSTAAPAGEGERGTTA